MDALLTPIITSIENSSVGFLTDFVGSYWATILTIGAVLFVGRWFLRLTGIGR